MQVKNNVILLSIILAISLIMISSCNRYDLEPGPWRAVIIPDTTNPELELPFNMEFIRGEADCLIANIHNASEIIKITEIAESDDSIFMQMPVFEGFIKAAKKEDTLKGTYTHQAAGKSWTVPFEAFKADTNRFKYPDKPAIFDVSGKWRVEVNPGGLKTKILIGEFKAYANHLTGTFLSTTGDYRYMEGKVSNDRFMLSAFDGAHALVFTARLSKNGTLEDGVLCGGPQWTGSWRAERDPDLSLPDAGQLTYLNPGYEKVEFSFPDLTGKTVSPNDDKYKGKVLIIQIIGSWCPNSMDESFFFAQLYRKYKTKGLEIIALCYESEDIKASNKAIQRFKNDINAGYTFLYAGVSDKQKASESLPMINRVISYPTAIFIDRNGKVRKIFTGFTGPGTGRYFEQLSDEMIELIESML